MPKTKFKKLPVVRELVRDFDSKHNFEIYEYNKYKKSQQEESYLEYFDKDEVEVKEDFSELANGIWDISKSILTQTEFEVLYCTHYLRMSQRELLQHISAQYSQAGVFKILKRAEEKLRKYYTKTS